ncbi:helix-turn-helix transcriptional regulator [Streptomyces sp. NPDC057403]|uniref:helix-turn-helix transcriptional regulator n=1 Tax=Streptomyces sp. NPDC057403 TaxID=3346119 RepID=UPI0036832C99
MTATVADQIRSRLRVRLDLPSPAQRRELREAAGLTQQELGAIVGVGRKAVSHWEAGIRTPRGLVLDRYVEALNALRHHGVGA